MTTSTIAPALASPDAAALESQIVAVVTSLTASSLPPTAAGRLARLQEALARLPEPIADLHTVCNRVARCAGLYFSHSVIPDQTKHTQVHLAGGIRNCVQVVIRTGAHNIDKPDDVVDVFAHGYCEDSSDTTFNSAQNRGESAGLRALLNIPLAPQEPATIATPTPAQSTTNPLNGTANDDPFATPAAPDPFATPAAVVAPTAVADTNGGQNLNASTDDDPFRDAQSGATAQPPAPNAKEKRAPTPIRKVSDEDRNALRALLAERNIDENIFVHEHSKGYAEDLSDKNLKPTDVQKMKKALGIATASVSPENEHKPASDKQRSLLKDLLDERALTLADYFPEELGITNIDSSKLTMGICSKAIDGLTKSPKPASGAAQQPSAQLRLAALLAAIPQHKHADLFRKHGCTGLADIPDQAIGRALVRDATAYIEWARTQTGLTSTKIAPQRSTIAPSGPIDDFDPTPPY